MRKIVQMSNVLSEREVFISLVAFDRAYPSDAAFILQGDGCNRILHASNLVNQGSAKFLVYSGGANLPSYGSLPFSCCDKIIKQAGVAVEKIIVESNSLNTKEQALNAIRLCIDRKWNRITIVASHYHQFRAFLTFLKVIIDSGLERELILINSPVVDLLWFTTCNWGTSSRYEILNAEFFKIEEYREKGDVASFYEAINYLKWRESQL